MIHMLFRTVERTSSSISECLLEFSKERHIDIKLLDFELISYETLLKKSNNTIHKITQDISLAQLQDSSLEIIQTYTINIFPFIKQESPILLSLSANKAKTKAVITIKEGSVFGNKPALLKDLKNEIWKKKLRAGFLINVFEDNLDTQLAKLLKIIPYGQAITKEIKFTVASGISPIEPRDAKLEKIYEKKSVESASIIAGVNQDELIAIYRFAEDGVDGRACDGKYIIAKKALILDKEPEINDTIREKIFDDYTEYYANVDGYPLLHKDKLSISKTLQLKEANFKSTANINGGGQDIDISVNIKHDKTHNEDAIGSGVKIDVKELNVDGSIASNVNIATENLNVDAQTHKNSKMLVKDTATIKLHRGDLSTKNAHIDILESGKVTASESIKVRQMLGGVVIAPVVKIDEVLANTTIIASELIEIKSISGEHNTLIIDPDAIQSHRKEVADLQEEIQSKLLALKEDKQLLDQKIQTHSAQLDRIKVFQKRVLEASRAGKTPMKQDLIRVKQFKKDSQKLALEKEQLKEQSSIIFNLEQELDKFCNKDLYAKIKSNTIYDGHTKVIFIDMKTREELSYIPKGRADEISLSLNAQNKRVISIS